MTDFAVGIIAEVLAWLSLAVGGGIGAVALWDLCARTHRLLPPQRQRAVPWGGFEVLAALVLLLALNEVAQDVLAGSNFYRQVYGVDLPSRPASGERSPAWDLAIGRIGVWATVFSFPFELAVIVWVLRVRSDVRPYQFGLSTDRITEDVVAGFVFWLGLTLPVLALDWGIKLVNQELFHLYFAPHPLERVLMDPANRVDWVLTAIAAVVVAPVLEELLFRGLIQGWLMRRAWGGGVAVAWAFGWAALAYVEKRASPEAAGSTGSPTLDALDRLAPVLFVLVMLPGYIFAERLAWRWLPYPNVAPTIYGTALLFAAFHSSVWPSPIPLFFLALGLGYLAHRTQSLVGPVVIHALFNGVGVLSMFLRSP